MEKRTKKSQNKLHLLLETLQKNVTMKMNFSAGPNPTGPTPTKSLKYSKIFSFHKKGPHWKRTSGICHLKRRCYQCTKCTEHTL